ncbi:MAG: EamA family transporter [Eubacteriales bacterium]
MIGYLFVAFALFCGAAKGYCGKKTSGTITSLPSTLLFNAVRMCLCIPIGLLFVGLNTGTLGSLAVSPDVLLISALSGLSTALFVVTWILCIRSGAYMMVDVFLTLGVIVPVGACAVFFRETIRWNQLLGILLLAAAAYIMCTYSNSIKEKLSPRTLLLLILSGTANGITAFAQKWFRYRAAETDVSVFNLYTYLFSSVVLILCFLFAARHEENAAKEVLENRKKLGIYVVIMSLCLFLHSFFSTMAAGSLSASQLYPLMQGGSLILSMVMSAVFFKEKITPRCLTGIALTFLALLLINML